MNDRALAPSTAVGQAMTEAASRLLELLRYLTDIDHHDHEALVALDLGGRGVGVARYIRHPADPQAAEPAVAIVDDWHRRGEHGGGREHEGETK